jgi:ankyrin repeat protein
VQPGNTWPIEQLPTLVACHLVQLLIRHGANPQARDYRGATLLHWACGTGHWAAAKVLLSCRDCNHHGHNGDDEVDVGMNNDKSNHATMATAVATRDGATPLHWAAAGTNTREFGVGGHVEVCRNLLEHVRQIHQERQQQNVPNHTISVLDYVNQATYDGNSALMWAAWSGTLDTVKLLVRNRADASIQNRNGCTVAHWAASGGNLAVCQYLYNVAHVDFGRPNFGGNTPLTHAVAFGRTSVVSWLMDILPRDDKDEMVLEGSSGFRDSQAYRLAHDFVHWTDGQDSQRRKVLQLFDEELYGLPSASDS